MCVDSTSGKFRFEWESSLWYKPCETVHRLFTICNSVYQGGPLGYHMYRNYIREYYQRRNAIIHSRSTHTNIVGVCPLSREWNGRGILWTKLEPLDKWQFVLKFTWCVRQQGYLIYVIIQGDVTVVGIKTRSKNWPNCANEFFAWSILRRNIVSSENRHSRIGSARRFIASAEYVIWYTKEARWATLSIEFSLESNIKNGMRELILVIDALMS